MRNTLKPLTVRLVLLSGLLTTWRMRPRTALRRAKRSPAAFQGVATDVYRYTSGGSEWVTIATAGINPNSIFQPVFDLIAPDGGVLARDQVFLESFRLTNAGVYQIVSRESGADSSGTYQLTLIHNPGPNLADSGETNRIVAGQTVTGTMSQADLDAYEYTSGGSEWVTIATAGSTPTVFSCRCST